jgi:hypothetical protein
MMGLTLSGNDGIVFIFIDYKVRSWETISVYSALDTRNQSDQNEVPENNFSETTEKFKT